MSDQVATERTASTDLLYVGHLSREEIDVLMVAVAKGVNPQSTATNALEASAVIWSHPDWDSTRQRQIICSLATMFAEVRGLDVEAEGLPQ